MSEKKKELPSLDELNNSKFAFAELVDDIISKRFEIKKSRITINDRLDVIKDDLLRLKYKVENGDLPYPILCELIKTKLNLSISAGVLRNYCRNELGFAKIKDTAKKVDDSVSDNVPSNDATDAIYGSDKSGGSLGGSYEYQ